MIINFVYDLHPDICLSILFLQRITAKDALDAEYFWTDPLPCDPKRLDLPCTLVIYFENVTLKLCEIGLNAMKHGHCSSLGCPTLTRVRH